MVSAVLLRFLWAGGLFALARMFSIAGYYYLTNADELCQRFTEGAEKMPKS